MSDQEWAARVYEHDKRTAEICRDMQVVGFRFDVERAGELSSFLRKAERVAIDKIGEACGYEINPLSPNQLQWAFFTHLKAPIYFRSSLTGRPSLGVDAMRGYAACARPELRQLALAVLEYRRARKLRRTYVEGATVGPDGRVHPTWLNYGTVSGRFSCQSPNLQNLPTKWRDPTAKLGGIRSLYHASPGHRLVYFDYCVAPGSRVLCSDLVWRRADEIDAGQRLVAFDEQLGRGNRLRTAEVERVTKRKAECCRVVTDRGTLICSVEHMLVARWNNRREWVRAKDLRVGHKISYLVEPWETDETREGGWMAGMLDGEGWVSSGISVGVAQNTGPVLEELKRKLRADGFDFEERSKGEGRCTTLRIRGEWSALRVVGRYRPMRLLPKVSWDGRRSWSRNAVPARVLSIEPIGEQDVVSIKTTTSTMIVEGMLSHNCQLEMRIAAYASGDRAMIDACESLDLHAANAVAAFGAAFRTDEWGAYKQACAVAKAAGKDEPEAPLDLAFLRNVAKQAGFAICYGANAQTVYARILADGHEIELRQVETMLRNIRAKFRDYYRWQDQSLLATIRNGWVASPLLGRRRMTGHDPDATVVMNFPIQGGAADVENAKLREILEELQALGLARSCPLVAQVHDSNAFEVPDRHVDTVCEVIRSVTSKPVAFSTSGARLEAVFPIDLEVLDRWH